MYILEFSVSVSIILYNALRVGMQQCCSTDCSWCDCSSFVICLEAVDFACHQSLSSTRSICLTIPFASRSNSVQCRAVMFKKQPHWSRDSAVAIVLSEHLKS